MRNRLPQSRNPSTATTQVVCMHDVQAHLFGTCSGMVIKLH